MQRMHPDGHRGATDALDEAPITVVPALDAFVTGNWETIKTYHHLRAVVDLLNVQTWNGRDHAENIQSTRGVCLSKHGTT